MFVIAICRVFTGSCQYTRKQKLFFDLPESNHIVEEVLFASLIPEKQFICHVNVKKKVGFFEISTGGSEN